MWQSIRKFTARASLAQRFMIASLIILVAGMLGIGSWVNRRIEDGVIHRTAATTALYVDSFVAPHLQALADGNTIPPEEIQTLDWLLLETSLGQEIAAFKVWDATGTILYSTDPPMIGQVFPVDDSLQRAWRGEVAADISELDAAENALERQRQSELIEIYTPVRLRGSDQVIAVAEFYQTTGDLRSELASARQRSWLVVGGATLLMYLLLAIFVQRISNTIARQQRELSQQVKRLHDLLAQNEQLSDRVRRAAGRTSALNERFLRRFSSELHDGPAQDLSLALLRLDNVVVRCAEWTAYVPGAAECADELDAIEGSIQRALQEVRTISAGLLLPQLGNLGTEETLWHVVRAHERRTGTRVEVSSRDLPRDVPLATKIALYRVIQEALNNAYHHAGGIGQHVSVAGTASELVVEVSDQGQGFDAASVAASDEHLGLVGMRERVVSLGGRLNITSAAGQGTAVVAHLPLETEANVALGSEAAHV